MKLIDSDKAYEVLDGLFAAIQKNGYVANQQMLDKAWEKWCSLPTAFDSESVIERLENERYPAPSECDEEFSEYAEGVNDMVESAIEIVKSGGVSVADEKED